MKITGGPGEDMPEGPLEKQIQMENVEEKVEAGKQEAAKRLDDMAARVEAAGSEFGQRLNQWEENKAHYVGDVIRRGSDYLEEMQVSERLELVADRIRKDPTRALLIAVGAGLALGILIRRR